MAIYIDDIGQGELPLQINNPQDGESLVWSEELGAYVNAPGGGASTEQIQDTVADMLEVDPDGSQLALRLVSSYNDTTGKLTFNVVTDAGGSGSGTSGIVIKEDGATRGVAPRRGRRARGARPPFLGVLAQTSRSGAGKFGNRVARRARAGRRSSSAAHCAAAPRAPSAAARPGRPSARRTGRGSPSAPAARPTAGCG